MNSLRIGEILPTRDNTKAVFAMRKMDPGDTMLDLDTQLDSLQRGQGNYAGLYVNGQLSGFIESRDWRWGFQRHFERNRQLHHTEDIESNDTSMDSLEIEGNPLGIVALHANRYHSLEFGGPVVFMSALVDHVVSREPAREMRSFVLAENTDYQAIRMDADPARLALVEHGFETTRRIGSRAGISYELFRRPATPVDVQQ